MFKDTFEGFTDGKLAVCRKQQKFEIHKKHDTVIQISPRSQFFAAKGKSRKLSKFSPQVSFVTYLELWAM